jgi:trk system potassium uptake protein TrkH
VFFSLFLVILSTFLLLTYDVFQKPHEQTKGKFLEYLFEAVSAFGTVGLSTGVTDGLSVIGKIVITILMFLGRLGPLTLAIAMKVKAEPVGFRYMEENVLVG